MASLPGIGKALNKAEKFSPASTFIEAVEYNPKENSMDITFKSGSKRRYLDVSPVTFLSFKQSPTFDSYYARAIKGNLSSVPLIDASIGREKSVPLNKIKREGTLDRGFKVQQGKSVRRVGTVSRAFAGS
jgi:hypothetical protein